MDFDNKKKNCTTNEIFNLGGSGIFENDHRIYIVITGERGGKNLDFHDHEIKAGIPKRDDEMPL